jgi:hypothetical protein
MDPQESSRTSRLNDSLEVKIARIDERTGYIKEKIDLHCSQLLDHEHRIQQIESCQKVIESPSFYQKYQGLINLLSTLIIAGGFYYFMIFVLHVHGAATT